MLQTSDQVLKKRGAALTYSLYVRSTRLNNVGQIHRSGTWPKGLDMVLSDRFRNTSPPDRVRYDVSRTEKRMPKQAS